MIRLVITTFANAEDAAKAVRTLVEERFAACGTVLPGVRSIYRWKEAIEDEHGVFGPYKDIRRKISRLGKEVALHPSL